MRNPIRTGLLVRTATAALASLLLASCASRVAGVATAGETPSSVAATTATSPTDATVSSESSATPSTSSASDTATASSEPVTTTTDTPASPTASTPPSSTPPPPASTPPPSSAPPAAPATQVTLVSPFTDDGRLRLPRDAGSDSVDVQDCSASLLRGGALLQCGPNVAHFVACWEMWVVDPASGPSGMPLLCMRSPWDSTVWEVRSSSTAATPGEIDDPVAGARPWGLRLADGQRCEIRSGGAWGMPPAGYVFTYSCTGGMLLMEPEDGSGIDRSAARWQVHTYRADTATAGTAEVAEAMFAGPTWQRNLPTCPSETTLNAAAQPDYAVKSGFPRSCAGNWAVMAVYSTADPSKMPRPASFASSGGTWTADFTPASTFCASWPGKPLPLLIWCYVS